MARTNGRLTTKNRTVTGNRTVPDSMRDPGRHIEIWDSHCVTFPSGSTLCSTGENSVGSINGITFRTTPHGNFLMRGIPPGLFGICRHACERDCGNQGVASCIVHCALCAHRRAALFAVKVPGDWDERTSAIRGCVSTVDGARDGPRQGGSSGCIGIWPGGDLALNVCRSRPSRPSPVGIVGPLRGAAQYFHRAGWMDTSHP